MTRDEATATVKAIYDDARYRGLGSQALAEIEVETLTALGLLKLDPSKTEPTAREVIADIQAYVPFERQSFVMMDGRPTYREVLGSNYALCIERALEAAGFEIVRIP